MRHTTTQPVISKACPVCGGCGFVMEFRGVPEVYGWDDMGEPVMMEYAIPCRKCRGSLEDRAARNRDRSGIPYDYRKKYRDHFRWDLYPSDTKKHEKIVNHFIDHFSDWSNRGKGLYIFSGTKGTGKTLLSCVIANELMALYGIRVKFVLISDLISQIKQADKEGGVNPIAVYSDTDVLVLDDMGSTKGNNWLDDSLFRILDSRMHSKKVTIITSNLPFDKLPHDERVTNRVYECCIPVKLPDISIRTKQAEADNKSFLQEIGLI